MTKPDRKYEVFDIKVADVFFDWEFNCRDQFSLESVRELADTIKAEGLHFPLVVQPCEEDDKLKWRLVCGHRRFRAVTAHLGWTQIPAMIRDDLTDQQARMLNLRENLERRDLNILEEAKAIKAIFPDGVSLRVGAEAFSRSERWVQSRLRLMLLPVPIQRMAAAKLISALDIDQLVKLPAERQMEVAEARVAESGKLVRGRAPKKQHLKRKFRHKVSKAQVNTMIEYLWSYKIDGLPSRLLAWANGYVTDEVIKKEIRDASGRRYPIAKVNRPDRPSERYDSDPDLS